MPDYGLGRLAKVDERDRQYPMRAALPAVTPPAYRYWVTGSVLNQNGYPQCVAYAWKQWLMSSPIRQGAKIDTATLYHDCQLNDEWPGEDYDGTSVRAGAKVLTDRGFITQYRWAESIADIRDWILLRGPVVLGTTWYDNMFYPDSKGYVYPTGGLAGGHAYMAYGYSSTYRRFRCINSWGADWGQNGRFWLKESDLQTLLFDDGEACVATEET